MNKKLYNKQIIAHIQNCLNTGNIEITTAESYDTLLPNNCITLGDIRVIFCKSDHPKLKGGYVASATFKDDVTKEYYKEWKTYPVGSHLMNDFKRLNKDQFGNMPYKELIYTDAAGLQKRALVRHLYEIDEMDADMPECQDYYNNYADLIHQNQCFLIIKIVPVDDPNYTRAEKVKIGNISEFEYDPFSHMTPVSEDEAAMPSTAPLFGE